MTQPQVWTMMGVFTTLMFGTLTIISTLFVRVVRAEVSGLRAEIGGLRNEMNARFLSVDTRLEGLDRDVQALVKKNFGLDRG